MDSAPAAAPDRPRTRARVRTSHLAPAALRVACDHALFEFLAPWMRNGCALYAANKEIQRGAVLYRRRRLGKLAALRREVLRLRDANCFVNLSRSTVTMTPQYAGWHKIIDVRGDTVILENLFKNNSNIHADRPNRFHTEFVRLEQWRPPRGKICRRGDAQHGSLCNCWDAGVYMYNDHEAIGEDY